MGIRFDIEPPPSVTDYWERRATNLRPSFNHRDVWLDEHARAFTVAKAMQADVLAAIRDEVGRAIEEGRTYEQFQKDLKPTLQKLGWWGRKGMVDPQTGKTVPAQLGSPRRLKTIYWANTRTARAAGLWSRAQATKRVLPYFRYGLGPSEKHRPHHASKAGIVLPVDHPWWAEWFPPNGWGCKCWVRQIGAAEAERLGSVTEPPVIETRKHINTRLPLGHPRRETWVPVGIDPGWHGNPGLAAERALTVARKADDAAAGLRAAGAGDAALRRMVGEVDTAARVDAALEGIGATEELIPVAVPTDATRSLLRTQAHLLFVSIETLRQHERKHPEADGAGYAGAVQDLLDDAPAFDLRDPDGRRVFEFIGEVGGQWWQLRVKVSGGDELLTLTLFHGSAGKLRRAERRAEGGRYERLR